MAGLHLGQVLASVVMEESCFDVLFLELDIENVYVVFSYLVRRILKFFMNSCPVVFSSSCCTVKDLFMEPMWGLSEVVSFDRGI